MKKDYYVYGLFDSDGKCFYIGKGRGKRCKDHRKNFKNGKITNWILYCKLKSIFESGSDFEEKILINDMTEKLALEKETELITEYGKRIESKGTLCNVLDGGTQPPSTKDIIKIYGMDFFKKSKEKQVKSLKKVIYKKNKEKIEYVQKLLNENVLIKDIANELKIDRNTISNWIKRYNLKYSNEFKKMLERERLSSLREVNSKKIQKTSKTYTVITPNGSKITTSKLVQFCKENNLDYKNLRNTFNRFKANGEPCKSKGFYISIQT